MELDRTSPLYRQIVEDIKGQITSGKLKIGARIDSHRKLADRYGVSLITVKQALKLLIAEGYLRAHAGKGTFVNRAAPPPDLTRHRSIGLVIPKLEDPFFHKILAAIEEEAYRHSYNVLLTMSGMHLEKEREQIDRYRELGVDGLIIGSLDPSHHTPAVVRDLHRSGFPYVLVSYVRSPDIYCVTTNQEKGAYMATKHLIGQGYRRIGYAGTFEQDHLSHARCTGYRQALEMHGLKFDRRFVYHALDEPGWDRYAAGYALGRRLTEATDRPDALFAYNDMMAIGLQCGLREAGLKLPDDMAIVGFDGVDFFMRPPFELTTVRQPVARIGREAFRVLIKRIHNDFARRSTLLEPELHVGSTSQSPKASAEGALDRTTFYIGSG